jgi:multidrug efflux pump subunit AcrA (membrane-fusion protein)
VGAPVGDAVEVIEGLKPGERVVSEGSFFLRAEAARTRAVIGGWAGKRLS